MQNIFIKICGITRVDDAVFACKYGVDALGFICWNKSKRFIPAESVKEIVNKINIISPNIKKVGVFVNESIENIEKYVDAGINIIQFHGDEMPNNVKAIKEELNGKYKDLEFWKAKGLKSEKDLDLLKKYNVDKFLVDAHVKNYGGSGKLADWDLAAKAVAVLGKPVILAGGLKPDNVNVAIEKVKSYGIDLSSGVELSSGKKDHLLIKKLFNALS